MEIQTNIDEFIGEMNNAIEAYVTALPEAVQIVATDAIATMKNRFIQDGLRVSKTEELISFPEYSEAYKKVRQKKGLSPKQNRLVFTGNMLRSIKITDAGTEKNNYFVEVSSDNNEEKNKAEYNSNRYGDIFALADSEKESLTKTFITELDNSLKKTGLFE